jgi:hypothetical protein
MKTEIIILIAIAFVVFLFAMGGISKLLKFRHEFVVPTGCAGLLHHHGKFIELLSPDRHVRWGATSRRCQRHAQGILRGRQPGSALPTISA